MVTVNMKKDGNRRYTNVHIRKYADAKLEQLMKNSRPPPMTGKLIISIMTIMVNDRDGVAYG